MTTIATAPLVRSAPHRFRRDMVAALAGAALFASCAFVAGQLNDDDARPPAVAATMQPSTVDISNINGAIHVSTAPDAGPAVGPTMRLELDAESWKACGDGVAELCHSSHTWMPVNVLDGIEIATRDLEFVLR